MAGSPLVLRTKSVPNCQDCPTDSPINVGGSSQTSGVSDPVPTSTKKNERGIPSYLCIPITVFFLDALCTITYEGYNEYINGRGSDTAPAGGTVRPHGSPTAGTVDSLSMLPEVRSPLRGLEGSFFGAVPDSQIADHRE
ncbi:hypothetical protein VMCG_04103 [Cytospora schulzeri]|uniref:Uncharacterized protein n=1 Tax=Cytospora schulzeri TaxID=448051 RepID=A0A423WUF3_9PEZI|nr:hypothetical protein VMCG_04103 [Valsa malicola]